MKGKSMEGLLAVYAADPEHASKARTLSDRLRLPYLGSGRPDRSSDRKETSFSACLAVSSKGVCLEAEGVEIRGDFSQLIPRIRPALLRSELLVRASGINKKKEPDDSRTLIDATAGMGEDAFLLAAAGFSVTLYEKDPIIAALLRDTMERAMQDPRIEGIVQRMTLVEQDSIEARMQSCRSGQEEAVVRDSLVPDVILLDPMFPERRKSASVKKKFQLLHILERPCEEEAELLQAAMLAGPGRILVKRPLKGPWLAGVKPSFSLSGKAVRIDCLLPVYQTPEKR